MGNESSRTPSEGSRGDVRAPEVAEPPSADHVEAVGPHVASGCYVLLEADADVEAIENAVGADGEKLWSRGPISVVRRAGKSTNARVIDADQRAERQGPEVCRLVHRAERRLHRYVRHTFRSTVHPKDGVDRELLVTGFEVVLADRRAFFHRDDASIPSGDSPRRLIPAVVIVHLDPTAKAEEAESGFFELSADSIKHKLHRLLRAHHRQFCSQIQQLLASPASVSLSAFNTGTKRFEPCTALEDVEASRPVVRVLGTGEGDTAALLPIYTVTSVAADSAARARELLEHEENRRKSDVRDGDLPDASVCSVDALRASRSEALATLWGDQWADGAWGDDRNDDARSALSWRGWHATFTPQGAGFAYIPEDGTARPRTHRRDQLSVVFADLLALEVLKGRILKDFSDRLHHIAENLLLHPDRHETALGIWKEFAVFTTDYAAGVSEVGPAEEQFLHAFRRGLSWDTDKAIERTQANLDRLADIARMQQEEQRRMAEEADRVRLRRREQWKQEERELAAGLREKEHKIAATTERRFTFFVGFVATLFLPLTVIPPVLEWFYENPEVSSAAPRAMWTGGGLVVFAVIVIVYWRVMKRQRDRDEAELAKDRQGLRRMQEQAHTEHGMDRGVGARRATGAEVDVAAARRPGAAGT